MSTERSDAAVGDNSVNPAQLLAFIERVENLNKEIKDRNDDKSAVFGEAKSAGLDVRIMKEVVRIRAQDPTFRFEHDAILDVYLRAVGLS